jgi:hypothetical protein
MFISTAYEGNIPFIIPHVLVCDLIDPALSGEVISPLSVFVQVVQNPVAISAAFVEIGFPNAVINTGSPSFICISTVGNRNLQWEARNVSGLNDGEITEDEASTFINYVIDTDGFSLNRSVILVNAFELSTSGYISCSSRESNVSSHEVFFTAEDPLWRVISPHFDNLPMGARVNLTLQYGDSSDGIVNNGRGFAYSLYFLPCVETLPDQVLTAGVTSRFGNTIDYTVHARLADSGEYKWNGTHLGSMRAVEASSNVTVVQPFLVEFDTVVYAQPSTVITLRCLPNDTRAPILWRQ